MLGNVVPTCNPSTQEVQKFKGDLAHIKRLDSKNKQITAKSILLDIVLKILFVSQQITLGIRV